MGLQKLKSTSTVKKALPHNGIKAKFPKDILPMLATLVDKPFNNDEWLYEVKWDGYRSLALSSAGKVDLKSRNNKSFNEKFYPIYEAVTDINMNVVLDGEIVAVNDKGLPDFGLLQNWRSEADGMLKYYVFDIIWLDGKDLTSLPLIERREILKAHVQENEFIQISQVFDNTDFTFFESAKELGLEGIMAKRKDSLYLSGDRTNDWLKMKSGKRQEVIIAGYTNNEGSNKPFSALLVGVYEKGKLHYIGKIGTGFNIKEQKEMLVQFAPLITSKPAFQEIPDIDKPSRFRPNPPKATVTWLKPKLVCEVTYNEITSDGVMRHPSFKGMRIDKPAREIVEEKPVAIDAKVKNQKKSIKDKIIAVPKKSRKTLLNPTDETQVKKINGHDLKFTNLSKVFWPDDNVTKRDLINYYYQMAPYILPYLKNRPQSLNRYPNGINGESFYQKDVTGKAPEWMETFLYHSEADLRDRHFLVPTDEASLLYMASLGCIEMNPWNSRVQTPDNPDWCIIDLDPDKNTFEQVIQAAQTTKQILDDMNVPSYCKTSGSTGIHIYIPLGAKYSYEQSKEFARVIATLVHKELPKFTSIERKTADRGGKMYIDFLQNRPQATIASPYSLRPKPGATVSMPLQWDEVKKGLKMKDFTIFNAVNRVAEVGDIFKPVIGKGIDLIKVVSAWQKK